MKNILKSKVVSEVIACLIVFLFIAAYCNIGYYAGKSYVNAVDKMERGEQLNAFQKFQNQVHWYDAFSSDKKDKIDRDLTMAISIALWPLPLLISFIVVVFKFVFLGGFFRLIAGFFKKIF
ncbi:MAG: hypothetical protein Q8N59_01360 [bacterium]|nr:hypothetical protein [bacterium]